MTHSLQKSGSKTQSPVGRILVCGDMHGNRLNMISKIKLAHSLDIKVVMVLGDFGVWPGRSGRSYLDSVNDCACEYDVDVFALPGNHEDHPQWMGYLDSSETKRDGFSPARSNVWLSPRVHKWTWDGCTFAIAGGAVSIDRHWRQPGVSWWPEEQLSSEEIETAMAYGKVDYLLTHDCSDNTPFGHSLTPDVWSKMHRKEIDRIIASTRPDIHLHGHMHHWYEWDNSATHGQQFNTKTYGLDCEAEPKSAVVLDIVGKTVEIVS